VKLPKGEHLAEYYASESTKGANEARKFNPRSLAKSKRAQKVQSARNATEAATAARIDKKAANKRAKLAKREAKRRGLQ